jgi:hypothetical protein
MARARNLKPGFFKNETLAECSPLARLLFAGLWCLADRAGRLEDRPKRIRAEILPYDDGSVDDMLTELHEAGFILRYEVAGQQFIQVLNFAKHQNPHCREPESTIPAPGEHSACTMQASGEHGTGPADSLNPLPDSLNPITATSPAGDRLDGDVPGDVAFAEFWSLYPRKVAKQAAMKAWTKLKPNAELVAKIMAAVERQAESPQWRKDGGAFIPHPASWLHGRRWEDADGGGETAEIGGIGRRMFA